MKVMALILLACTSLTSFGSSNCVVLDAGHGGHDKGALNHKYDLQESEENLEISLDLAARLRKRGVKAMLTRNDDYFISLDERVRLSQSSGCDYFISVHHNSYQQKTQGFETYYNRSSSKEFAFDVHTAWAPSMISPNRGVKVNGFAVIKNFQNSLFSYLPTQISEHAAEFFIAENAHKAKNPKLKSILLELYFIDNPLEVKRYNGNNIIPNALTDAIEAAVQK